MGDVRARTGNNNGAPAIGSGAPAGRPIVDFPWPCGYGSARCLTEPYSDDDLNYGNDESRVSREHEDESLQNVALTQTTPDGFADYDTVFVGYPIWWGVAAWPTNGFASGNDFTGKTVIPFCTSASSGLGQSGANLADLAGTGTWQEGQRFRSSASEDDVTEWLATL